MRSRVFACGLVASVLFACANDGPDADMMADADAAVSCHVPPPGPSNGCVSIDVSWYDRSCMADSDCVPVEVGTVCRSYECVCFNAAINVRGRECYDRSFPAPVLPEDAPACRGCQWPSDPNCAGLRDVTRCFNGLCTYCGG